MNNWFVGFAMGLLVAARLRESCNKDPPPDVDIPITSQRHRRSVQSRQARCAAHERPFHGARTSLRDPVGTKTTGGAEMKKRKDIDLTEHALLAKDIYHIKDCIYALRAFLLERKSTLPEISQLRSMEARLDSLRSKLDNKYHALIDNKTFDEFGHIYYSRGKRHESNG
jgi:hypothetical protein